MIHDHMAHFFMIKSGSKFRDQLAHFFIDIHRSNPSNSIYSYNASVNPKSRKR